MTNKLIERFENLVEEVNGLMEEAKVIVHQLRVPSTIFTVEDVIEFEGQQYKKVDRLARVGDYVSVSFEKGKCFKPNKIYGPVFNDNGLEVKADPSSGGEFEIALVYNDIYDRTPETVDVYELIVENNPKSANQQRAEVIEKAKKSIVNKLVVRNGQSVYIKRTGKQEWVNVEFVVNEEKRTVVAIARWTKNNEIVARGIAKCMPTDVFNTDIGKAIALGRALGLDVNDFENAMQPTFVMGQVISYTDSYGVEKTFQISKVEGHKLWDKNDYLLGNRHEKYGYENPKIINDTNAEYEVNA